MSSLLPGVAAVVSASEQVFSVPVPKGRAWNMSVIAVPPNGATVTGLKIQASIDGENFADITNTETFVADEVAALQYRQFPGLQAKVVYTSGVDTCKVVLT